MSLVLEMPPVPLHEDSDGVVRIGGTRVTLDTIVSAFVQGSTAEQIAQDYSTLTLADIYAVISFYLKNQPQVDSYLAERRKEGLSTQVMHTMRQQADGDSKGIRSRLQARQQDDGQDHAANSGG